MIYVLPRIKEQIKKYFGWRHVCCIPKNLPVGSLTRSTDVDLLRLRSVAGGRVLGPTAEPRRHACVWKTPPLYPPEGVLGNSPAGKGGAARIRDSEPGTQHCTGADRWALACRLQAEKQQLLICWQHRHQHKKPQKLQSSHCLGWDRMYLFHLLWLVIISLSKGKFICFVYFFLTGFFRNLGSLFSLIENIALQLSFILGIIFYLVLTLFSNLSIFLWD